MGRTHYAFVDDGNPLCNSGTLDHGIPSTTQFESLVTCKRCIRKMKSIPGHILEANEDRCNINYYKRDDQYV